MNKEFFITLYYRDGSTPVLHGIETYKAALELYNHLINCLANANMPNPVESALIEQVTRNEAGWVTDRQGVYGSGPQSMLNQSF